MAVQQTPGRWFGYASGYINAGGATQTVFEVPLGYQFLLSYIMLAGLATLGSGYLVIWADNVPLLIVGPQESWNQLVFTNPLVLTSGTSIGTLATINPTTISYVVTYDGQMVKIAGARPNL